MNRRSAIALFPLTLSGLANLSLKATAQEPFPLPSPLPEPPRDLPLSLRYTMKVRDMLGWIRRTQSENILEAAYAVARTVKKGGACWCSWDMGHNTKFDMFPGRCGNPGIFVMGYDDTKSKKGDLFLVSIWSESLEKVARKGVFIVGGPAPWGSDARLSELIVRDSAKHRIRPYASLWIDTNVTTLGAIMDVPGSPAPVGPVSGILGMTIFWMITADACRILARDGISLKVDGDEPELLKDKTPWVSLDAPLMGDYFDTVMSQIEMIGSELGNIRKIARIASDSLLEGGKVYVYSRYRNSLAVEGETRRGGLALTRGVFRYDGNEKDTRTLTGFAGEFKGTDKDLVIMGIDEPADEIDLQSLEAFRKMGMKVASMGPMTLDIVIPEGRIVPRETDVHVGRMCDTYGIFAVPGFTRKVCPTSGALLNQIFWASCMEIIEEIMRRTGGNVPGIFFSAAVKGGTEHMHRMHQWREERGY